MYALLMFNLKVERTHLQYLPCCSASPVRSHACKHTPQNGARGEQRKTLYCQGSLLRRWKWKDQTSCGTWYGKCHPSPDARACMHARTDTFSLYKKLIMKCVDPLESKYVPACFQACFFKNAIRTCCQKPTGVNPAAWAVFVHVTSFLEHSPSTRLLRVLPWGVGPEGGVQQTLGLSGLYVTLRINLHKKKQLCDLIHPTVYLIIVYVIIQKSSWNYTTSIFLSLTAF